MKDCRLVLRAEDGKFTIESANVTLEQLAAMCGVLQVICGKKALEQGADIDMVKDKMWDIYEAAMEDLEKHKRLADQSGYIKDILDA